MTNIAARNRQIKTVLSQAFGAGKIKVRGSRGTGYGYVDVRIDHTPLDADQASELVGLCKRLLHAANVDLGFAYTDDTCQYKTDQCHISFNQARYFRTMKHADGKMSVLRCGYDGEWESA